MQVFSKGVFPCNVLYSVISGSRKKAHWKKAHRKKAHAEKSTRGKKRIRKKSSRKKAQIQFY